MTKLSDKKIVVAQDLDLSQKQIERLDSLGNATVYKEDPKNAEEWLTRCREADIICSGSAFMKSEVYALENKFCVIPMVGYSWLDLDRLRDKNISLANCPGCNKHAVAEWVTAMTINLLRGFKTLINTSKSQEEISNQAVGLKNKNVAILGNGNIGTLVSEIFTSLGSKVSIFQRGDDLYESTRDSDIVINCLSTNPTTLGLLNHEFFSRLKRGVYFVTITPDGIHDVNAMLNAIEEDIIAGVATDCASVSPYDTEDEHYKRMSSHPRVLATPHIASFSDVSSNDENDMMIDDIEAWIKGEPINIISN